MTTSQESKDYVCTQTWPIVFQLQLHETLTDLVELEAEHDLKSFFSAVRKFYVATINKILQKFPCGDSLLKDLGILHPEKHLIQWTEFNIWLSDFQNLD